MNKVCFYDTKPYDKIYFDELKRTYGMNIDYYETKLRPQTARLAQGYDAVVAFVNDDLRKETIDVLYEEGVRLVAMRCAGYNNVDFSAARGKIHIVRVPAYSPNGVAEHAMAMLLTLNRKIHKAYIRTRDFNFSLNGLMGFNLYGKVMGIAGTGKIGRALVEICKGFGMEIVAFDMYPDESLGLEYVTFEELCRRSDVISLHCPLSRETFHMVNEDTLNLMKKNTVVINTSRGALIDSEALLQALKNRQIGGACLDVYEEETNLFYEDMSQKIVDDDTLLQLLSLPNVIVTSHQAFLTHEALKNIAETTLQNLEAYLVRGELLNEVTLES